MSSEIEICNRALTKLGEKTILSLGDDSKPARTMNILYAPTRDMVLRRHPWNFAIKRTTLAQSLNGPEYDYAYCYILPTDCLRVIKPNREVWEYGIEGRKLVTDWPGAQLKYISRITDVNTFDVSFMDALVCKLAAEAAITLTDNDSRHVNMEHLYNLAIQDARSNNAMEIGPQWIISEEWLNSRRVGISGVRGISQREPK